MSQADEAQEFLQAFGTRLSQYLGAHNYLPPAGIQQAIARTVADVKPSTSITIAPQSSPPAPSPMGTPAAVQLADLSLTHSATPFNVPLPLPDPQPPAKPAQAPALGLEAHKPGEQDLIRRWQQLPEAVQALAAPGAQQAQLAQAHMHQGQIATPPPDPPGTEGGRRLQLVFSHNCRNHGCNQPQCVLCKHNPNRRCGVNFAGKYWVGDALLAKCEAEIDVEVIDFATQTRVEAADLPSFGLELCIVNGNRYSTRCREAGEQRADLLSECEVLLNQKNEPLLAASGAAATDAARPRVVLRFPPGAAFVPLRDVKVTESSESVLAGTKRPPFRLVVRAVFAPGEASPPVILPTVSEEFVVVTKRTKNLKKQDIPSLDDPISKLNHVGKETVKKLNELRAAAEEASLDLGLPPDLHRITKVKDFQRLAASSEADGHLQQKLKQLLKLSKEKWDAACDHSKSAVQADNRMRAWYGPGMQQGLLYTCSMGDIRPDAPCALLLRQDSGAAAREDVIPMEQQMPAQREQVASICQQATECWWRDNHSGWMIYARGSRQFESLDQSLQARRSTLDSPLPGSLPETLPLPAPESQLPLDQDQLTGPSAAPPLPQLPEDYEGAPPGFPNPFEQSSAPNPFDNLLNVPFGAGLQPPEGARGIMHLPSDPGSLPMPPGQGPLVGSSRGGYNSLGDLQLPSGLPSLAGLNSSVLFPFRDSAMALPGWSMDKLRSLGSWQPSPMPREVQMTEAPPQAEAPKPGPSQAETDPELPSPKRHRSTSSPLSNTGSTGGTPSHNNPQ